MSLADLLHLLEADVPAPAMKMKAIAAQLHDGDPSSVTFLAERLLAKGLIEHAEDPRDRRSKGVRLTGEGARVRGELLAAMREESVLAAVDAGGRVRRGLSTRSAGPDQRGGSGCRAGALRAGKTALLTRRRG